MIDIKTEISKTELVLYKTEDKKKVQILTKEKLDLEQLLTAPKESLSVAGHSVTRTDDLQKVTGKLMYGADYPQEGFLHGKILRSPFPHALIKTINVDQAWSFCRFNTQI